MHTHIGYHNFKPSQQHNKGNKRNGSHRPNKDSLFSMHQTVRDSSSAHSEAYVYASRSEDDSDHDSTSAPLAKMRRDMQVVRTPTKKAAMHFDRDSDNSNKRLQGKQHGWHGRRGGGR